MMRMIMMTLVSGGQRTQVGVSQWAVCSFCRPPIHGHRSQDCLSVIIRMIIVITIIIIIIISFVDRLSMVIAPRIVFRLLSGSSSSSQLSSLLSSLSSVLLTAYPIHGQLSQDLLSFKLMKMIIFINASMITIELFVVVSTLICEKCVHVMSAQESFGTFRVKK